MVKSCIGACFLREYDDNHLDYYVDLATLSPIEPVLFRAITKGEAKVPSLVDSLVSLESLYGTRQPKRTRVTMWKTTILKKIPLAARDADEISLTSVLMSTAVSVLLKEYAAKTKVLYTISFQDSQVTDN